MVTVFRSDILFIGLMTMLLLVGGISLLFFLITVKKLLGIFFIIIGIFMTFFFPDVSDYQPKGFSISGIVIGIILIAAGILLVIFG